MRSKINQSDGQSTLTHLHYILFARIDKCFQRVISIPRSVSKWAMLMNVSRPSLHRELKKLEESDIIAYAPPMITIIDADALQDVLSQ